MLFITLWPQDYAPISGEKEDLNLSDHCRLKKYERYGDEQRKVEIRGKNNIKP